jgi:hypothetical protein
VSSNDLDIAIEAARVAREAAEAEAARKHAEDVSRRAREEALEERVRRQLREVGTTFVARARQAGIKPESVQVAVGSRDRHEGIFVRKKVGTSVVYERHSAWIVLAYQRDNDSIPARNGIYVFEDGRIIGFLENMKSMPHGTVEGVTQRLAEYLAARERR